MPHASCLNEKHVYREARWWNGPDHSVMGLMGQRSSETAQDTDHAQSGVSEQKPGVLIHTGETAQITDHTLTPSLPWCHFKTTNKCAKFETFKLFCLSFFFFFLGGGGGGALACERIFFKTHSTESRCYRTGNYTVYRHVPASFSLESVQAGAVKGFCLVHYASPNNFSHNQGSSNHSLPKQLSTFLQSSHVT